MFRTLRLWRFPPPRGHTLRLPPSDVRRPVSRRPAATRPPAPALLNASCQRRDPATTSRAAASHKSEPRSRPSVRPAGRRRSPAIP